MSFKNAIEFAEVACVQGGDGLGREHGLVVVEMLTGWQ